MTFSLLTAWVLFAASEGPILDAELAEKAETAFAEGLRRREAGEKSRQQFRTAAAAYEELRKRGASNALLYGNLGNARLLAGDLPGAILAYREGLRVAPNNQRLRLCLAEAREHVIFRDGNLLGRPPEENRPPWLPWGPGWELAFALLVYAAGCAALTRWLMLRRRVMLLAGAALLALAAVVGMVVFREEHGGPEQPIVVVAADGVLLRKGNGMLFPPRYETPLNRGVEARLLFRRPGWLQIELSGGEVGWLAENDAVVEE